ncbi:MAG: LytR/AlgR family response regulator transcription factor [Sediminibacterium sp.]
MIKILLLEDEIPARKKLKRFLAELDTPIEIVAELDTVAMGITFLKSNAVDVIFSDIELLDGNSFEIYNQVTLSCPIIFTTAYDQFWMNAFDSNGIDYLLKPFSKERFRKAWDKFMLFRNAPNDADMLLNRLTKMIEENFVHKSFKKRFAVHHRQGIYFLDTANISFFEASEGAVFAYDTTGKKHLLTESTLKEIEEQLNPSDFFRINRSELVNKSHVEKIEYYAKNTLAIKLKGYQKPLSTSQNNTAPFRVWIAQ